MSPAGEIGVIATSALTYAVISFLGAGSGNTGNKTAASSVSATLPASIQAGDVCIAQIVTQETGAYTPAFTIGGVTKVFTAIRADASTAATLNARSTLAYRVMDGTESGLVLAGSGFGTVSACMSALVYRNLNQSTPVSTSSVTASSSPTGVTSIATTSLTTTIASQWVASLYAKGDILGNGDTLGTPASTTSRQSNPTQGYMGLLDVDEIQVAAGASAARTTTVTTSSGMVAQALALTPAGPT